MHQRLIKEDTFVVEMAQTSPNLDFQVSVLLSSSFGYDSGGKSASFN
jgi:hypothetical protein